MSADVEEIKTISLTLNGGRFLSIEYVESDGVVSHLFSRSLYKPAVINGRDCLPGRRFTKESFNAALESLARGPTKETK